MSQGGRMSFTDVFIGLNAAGSGQRSTWPADLDRFD